MHEREWKMRLERSSRAITTEAAMFAGMVWAVATVLLIVVLEKGLWTALSIGFGVAVVVFLVVRSLVSGTLHPPRGPGNPPGPKSPPGPKINPAHREMPSPTMVDPKYQTQPLGFKATPQAQGVADEGRDVAPISATQAKPAVLDHAREGAADDLKKIKGVGPKLEGMLNSMGVFHLDQVANWSPEEVAWVDDNLEGFKGRVSRDDWVAQAKLLAGGGDTDFSERVEQGDVY